MILFEGILVFYFKDIRELFDMKLFVDTDADTRLSRRGVSLSPEYFYSFDTRMSIVYTVMGVVVNIISYRMQLSVSSNTILPFLN